VWFFVAEKHGTVFHFDDAAVGDGHFEDIGSKVSEAVLAGSNRLAVDVPIGLPYFGCNGGGESSLVHLMAKFSSKDFGQSFDGYEEVDARGLPLEVMSGDGSTRNDVVNVGVIVELADRTGIALLGTFAHSG